MPFERSSDVKFEIGHVLFIDIVGYSKLLISDFQRTLNGRNVVVCFKTNEAATSIYLFGKPVGVSAQVDAFDSSLEHPGILIIGRNSLAPR